MDYILYALNTYIVDPHILHVYDNYTAEEKYVEQIRWWPDTMRAKWGDHVTPYNPEYSLIRQALVSWTFLYAGALFIYFLAAFTTYSLFYCRKARETPTPTNPSNNPAHWKYEPNQVGNEIFTSVWSLCIMSGMTVPMELYVMLGHGKVYHNVSDYGWFYFFISPILFLIFTDTLIYWIHRGLHWGPLYRLHKLHHRYKETTPFSAFSFHPFDGYAQGFPYHIFVLCFPMHSILYQATLLMVGLWTVNIHDRMTLRLWGVNGAAHHTIHHTKFNYNYGQYFTFWDHVFGTFKDPYEMFPYNEADQDGLKAGRTAGDFNHEIGQIESNGKTNGHANGHTNGNGYANGHSNGKSNGHANGHTNGKANGKPLKAE